MEWVEIRVKETNLTRPKVAVEVAISLIGIEAWSAMRGGTKKHPMPIPQMSR